MTLPERVWKDALDRVLESGTRVAFNYSGNVASGTIDHITKGGEIHIKRDDGFGGGNPISKVKRWNSVLVIADNDVTEALKHQSVRHDTELTVVAKHFVERTDNLKLKVTALLEKIEDAWDVDEIQMYAEDLFGKDIHNPEYRSDLLEAAINQTQISKELQRAFDVLEARK